MDRQAVLTAMVKEFLLLQTGEPEPPVKCPRDRQQRISQTRKLMYQIGFDDRDIVGEVFNQTHEKGRVATNESHAI